MNFSDEEYVRLYTADTVTWSMLGWEGNALLALALRKFDRAGVFEFGRHGAERALAVATKLPLEVVTTGLEALAREQVWELKNDRIFWPKYIEAQTCKRSDRIRQRAARSRRSAEQQQDVTQRDTKSRNVTDNHIGTNLSQIVTLGEARRGEVDLFGKVDPTCQGGAGGKKANGKTVRRAAEKFQIPDGWRPSEKYLSAILTKTGLDAQQVLAQAPEFVIAWQPGGRCWHPIKAVKRACDWETTFSNRIDQLISFGKLTVTVEKPSVSKPQKSWAQQMREKSEREAMP